VAPRRCLAPRRPLNLRDDFSFSLAQRQPLDVAADEFVVDSGISALRLFGRKSVKHKFKAGDRIAVYGLDGNFNPVRVVTTVTDVLDEGILYTDEDTSVKRPDYDFSIVHPKQCRKIKGPRSVWLYRGTLNDPNGFTAVSDMRRIPPCDNQSNWVEFVEVRRK
jgi:hypothetical protein